MVRADTVGASDLQALGESLLVQADITTTSQAATARSAVAAGGRGRGRGARAAGKNAAALDPNDPFVRAGGVPPVGLTSTLWLLQPAAGAGLGGGAETVDASPALPAKSKASTGRRGSRVPSPLMDCLDLVADLCSLETCKRYEDLLLGGDQLRPGVPEQGAEAAGALLRHLVVARSLPYPVLTPEAEQLVGAYFVESRQLASLAGLTLPAGGLDSLLRCAAGLARLQLRGQVDASDVALAAWLTEDSCALKIGEAAGASAAAAFPGHLHQTVGHYRGPAAADLACRQQLLLEALEATCLGFASC